MLPHDYQMTGRKTPLPFEALLLPVSDKGLFYKRNSSEALWVKKKKDDDPGSKEKDDHSKKKDGRDKKNGIISSSYQIGLEKIKRHLEGLDVNFTRQMTAKTRHLELCFLFPARFFL